MNLLRTYLLDCLNIQTSYRKKQSFSVEQIEQLKMLTFLLLTETLWYDQVLESSLPDDLNSVHAIGFQ